jgi:hypothetical protein
MSEKAKQEQQQLSKKDRVKSGPPNSSANPPPIYDENFARRAGQIIVLPAPLLRQAPNVSSFHSRRQLFATTGTATTSFSQ